MSGESSGTRLLFQGSVPDSPGWSRLTPEAVGKELGSIDYTPLAGLPFPYARLSKRELRVLKRAAFHQCLQLEPSFFWRAFLATRNRRDRLLYRAFILNDSLSSEEWHDLIGRSRFESWCAFSLLEQVQNRFRWSERIIHTGYSALMLDRQEIWEHAYCGRDSLLLLDFCIRHLENAGRAAYLDVGVGAGSILCGVAPFFDSAVGIDINPRAVQLTRTNLAINNLRKASVKEADVFEFTRQENRYDVVSWNVPYLFVPEDRRRACNDGGELGISLAVRFVEILPSLLKPEGVAFLMVSSPVLVNGDRPLNAALVDVARDTDLDIESRGHFFLREDLDEEFLLANHVRAVEVVILLVRNGEGRFNYMPPSRMMRLLEYGLRP